MTQPITLATIVLHDHNGGMSTIDHPTQPGAGIFTMKVRSASTALGSQAKLATWVGVGRSQATRWADGETEPSLEAARAVTDLEFIISRARMVWEIGRAHV